MLRRVTSEPDLAYADKPEPLTGGFWAELVKFRLEGAPASWTGPLVARVMPDPVTAAKETAFQGEVAAQGYATPAVHAAGGPAEGVGGRAFMVMDLAVGQPLLAGLDGLGALLKLPSLARRLPVVLADVLVALHRLDPAPVQRRLAEAAVPQPGIDVMLASLRDAATRLNRDDLAQAAAWLQNNPPSPAQSVICHGDMHPFNVLVADDGRTTVLDWSASTFAPATYDLAFTSVMLGEPPLHAPGALGPVVRAAGRALSRRFLRTYERGTGAKVDRASLEWHQGLVCLRALIEVAGWVTDGTIEDRRGHPWLISGAALADRLHGLTEVPVRPR